MAKENSEVADMRRELTAERMKSKTLAEEVKKLKNERVHLQAATEQEDECRVNKLTKNLEQLKKEKQLLLIQVEQEEEYITNTLVKKLEQVRQEKIDLENQLEQEEEFITNKLQKQLSLLLNDKRNLEKKLEDESSEHAQLVKLEQEMVALRKQLKQSGMERDNFLQKNDDLKDQLLKLKTENFILGQRIKREQEKLSQVSNENVKLVSNLEIGDERRYNAGGKKQPRVRSVSLPTHSGSGAPSVSPRSSPRTPSPGARVLSEAHVKFRSGSAEEPDPKWLRRFCILLDSVEIYVFADEKKQTRVEVINLDTVKALREGEGSGRWGLELSQPNRTLGFLFDKEDVWRQWRDLLHDLIPKN